MSNKLMKFEAPDLGISLSGMLYQGRPVFDAVALAKSLGYKNPSDALTKHCKSLIKLNYSESRELGFGDNPRGFQLALEPDAYRLILRSQLESAERVQDWVCEDVLPTIRQTGTYAIASPVDAMRLLNDPTTLRGLLMNYSEDNQRLTGENQLLTATVDSLEKHFTKGMTIPAFCKHLNGVNINKMMWWAFERKWIFNERRDPEKSPKWRVASYARHKYLTEDETKITPHGSDEITKFVPVLLQGGCHRLYQLYMQGKLPMKKTWDGEFSHDKAIYTPESK